MAEVLAFVRVWHIGYGLFRRWQHAGVWRDVVTALQARVDPVRPTTWDISDGSTNT